MSSVLRGVTLIGLCGLLGFGGMGGGGEVYCWRGGVGVGVDAVDCGHKALAFFVFVGVGEEVCRLFC